MSRPRNLCQLMCGQPGVTSVGSYRLCLECIGRLRAIATDAGVVIDEGLIGGTLRRITKRALTKAERHLADVQERREIAAAKKRRSA